LIAAKSTLSGGRTGPKRALNKLHNGTVWLCMMPKWEKRLFCLLG